MKALVIYDSYYGNTAVIAETIAKELDCEHIKVHAFNSDLVNDYDLVVIGSPTRAFTATKEIKAIAKKLSRIDIKVALFDTRIAVEDKTPKVLKVLSAKFGYSNDTLEKILSHKNINPVIESGKFYVQDTEGPLRDEEIQNAKDWINQIKE